LWRLLARLKMRGAFLAAAIFAVHPVCVASVARIAEFKNTLSWPFFLASFLAYLRYEEISLYPAVENHPTAQRSRGTLYFAISLSCFVLALFSKTSTIMLPPLLLCCAWWQRHKISRSDLIHTAPHFCLSLGFGLLSSWYQKHQALAGQELVSQNLWERLVVAARAFWFYLGKAFLPRNLTIAYPRWHTEISHPSAFVPVGLFIALVLICWKFRQGWGRHALFGVGAFAIALFPAMGFFDAQFLTMWQVSDHLQYLPLTAAIALGAGIVVCIKPTQIFRMAGLSLVIACGLLAFQRAKVFATEDSLLRDTLAKNPDAWAAHNDLACLFAQRQNFPEAISHFEASLKSNPQNAEAHCNLGQISSLQNRDQDAATHFLQALKIKPFHALAHHRYATLLIRQGKPRAAILHLRAAVTSGGSLDARMDLSGLLYGAGDLSGAIEQLYKVVSASPERPDALNNLAWLLATGPDAGLRKGNEAVNFAKRACELTRFQQPGMLGTLAAAYAEAGRFEEAVAQAEAAAQLALAHGDRRFADLNRELGTVYRDRRAWHQKPVIRTAT
jgi:tetratricopeptide (TPR) repeat protein